LARNVISDFLGKSNLILGKKIVFDSKPFWSLIKGPRQLTLIGIRSAVFREKACSSIKTLGKYNYFFVTLVFLLHGLFSKFNCFHCHKQWMPWDHFGTDRNE
jgi:hypothetical protein